MNVPLTPRRRQLSGRSKRGIWIEVVAAIIRESYQAARNALRGSLENEGNEQPADASPAQLREPAE